MRATAGFLRACTLGVLLLAAAACTTDDPGREGWTSGLATRGQTGDQSALRGGSRTAIAGRVSRSGSPFLRPGTDEFVGPNLVPPPPGAIRQDEGVLLNFEEADLREVVASVLGDILELNYLYDPRVQGRVTLQTVAPLTDADTLAALELILRQNAGALVRRDDVYAVVPAAEAGSGAQVPVLANGAIPLDPGFAVLIAPLRSASASELAGVLEPLAGPQTTVRFDTTRNVLILAGASSDLASLRQTITMFDVDWLDGLSYGLFPLRNARAADVAEELETILGGPESPIRDQVFLDTVDRMNAVLVVTKRRKILQDVRGWVGRLDRDLGAGSDGVFVYRVENVPAVEVAAALTEVFGRGAGGGGPAPASAFAADTDLVAVAADGETALPAQSGASLDFGTDEDVRIFANPGNNTLVVRASPETYERIQAVIHRLDVAPLQVMIDATIAEVALTNQLNYGVQFFLDNDRRALINTTANSRNVGGAFPGFVASYTRGGAEVILSALDQVTRLNVISSPRILVLDNQSARLNVGDEVPIITQQQQSIEDDSNILNQVEFRQTGLILEVSPRVSSSGLVTLDILQETSNVVQDDTSGTLTPTISQRTIESSIAVQNGQTILLGGLIQQSDDRAKTGIPVLSEAPVVGNLFGTKRLGSDRTELIVLLTPRVIQNPHQMQGITDELRQRIQSMPPEFLPRNTLTARDG